MDNGQLTIDNYQGTNVPAFEMRWLKNTPTSETVGNGLCAVPGNVTNTPRVNEWHHPPYVIPTAASAEWRNPPKLQ